MLAIKESLALLGLAGAASAAMHTVEVGKGGLVFSPDSITAADGDQIIFQYYPGDHSVVQADFSKPCVPSANAFYSGVINSASGPATNTFILTVNGTDPIWYYCGALGHCPDGMVGVINPPSSGDTLDAFKSAASNSDGSSPPSVVQGGVVGPAPSGSSSASASSASATAAASSAAMSSAAASMSAAASGTTTGAASMSAAASGTTMGAAGTTAGTSGTATGAATASSSTPGAASDSLAASRGGAALGLVALLLAFLW